MPELFSCEYVYTYIEKATIPLNYVQMAAAANFSIRHCLRVSRCVIGSAVQILSV